MRWKRWRWGGEVNGKELKKKNGGVLGNFSGFLVIFSLENSKIIYEMNSDPKTRQRKLLNLVFHFL